MSTDTIPATDDEGFLLDWNEWSEALAERWAAADALQLSSAHWELLRLAREYYSRYHVAPGMRILVTLLRHADAAQGEQGGNAAPARVVDSRYLYRLFSTSPGRQVCRYAGLPKPVSCI